jgi:hypothetical protein
MTTAANKRGVSGWRLIAALVLLAFTVQSYVAQTHFHDVGLTGAPVSQNLGHGKAPVDDNPLNCPFCQAVAHAGAIFLPSAPLLFLSTQWVEMATSHLLLRSGTDAAAHNWQSRAPPLH